MTTASDSDLIVIEARRVISVALSHILLGPSASDDLVHTWALNMDVLREAWTVIVETHGGLVMGDLGLGELPPDRVDIEPVMRWFTMDADLRADAYTAVFGLTTERDCPLYETEFCHWSDPTYRSQQMADVGGFYRAFGVEPNPRQPDRCDHVALELEFVAILLAKLARCLQKPALADHAAVVTDATHHFLRDHVVWWVPTLGKSIERRVEQVVGTQGPLLREPLESLATVGRLLRAWTAVERISRGVEPCRQIIAPMVDPGACDSQDSDCDGCTSGGRE